VIDTVAAHRDRAAVRSPYLIVRTQARRRCMPTRQPESPAQDAEADAIAKLIPFLGSVGVAARVLRSVSVKPWMIVRPIRFDCSVRRGERRVLRLLADFIRDRT